MSLLTWTLQTTPWDTGDKIYAMAWSPSLGLFAAVGAGTSGGSGPNDCIMTSPDGVTWTNRGNPWGAGGNLSGQGYAIVWVTSLGKFVAAGTHFGSGTQNTIVTSTDGITWTPQTTGATASWALQWSDFQGQFVASATISGTSKIMTSPDAVTWTTRATIANDFISALDYSPDLDLWCGGLANPSGGKTVYTSPDGITWTLQTSSFDGSGSFADWLRWCPTAGLFVYSGADNNGDHLFQTSPDGITWTTRNTTVDSPTNYSTGFDLVDLGGLILGGVAEEDGSISDTINSSTDGVTWISEPNPLDGMAFSFGMGGCYSPDLGLVAFFGRVQGSGPRLITAPYSSSPPPVVAPVMRNVIRLT